MSMTWRAPVARPWVKAQIKLRFRDVQKQPCVAGPYSGSLA